MNQLDLDYQTILKEILEKGHQKKDRTGTGTLSLFGKQIRHKMSDGFPILTSKKVHFPSVVTELLWFLKGRTDIGYLIDNKCGIWNGDCYEFYKKNLHHSVSPISKEEFIQRLNSDHQFREEFGDLGPIYGEIWRNWGSDVTFNQGTSSLDKGIDQIEDLIHSIKNNPDSRRLMVTAWDPSRVPEASLPPCHYGFQIYTRELTWEERLRAVIKNTDVYMDNQSIIEKAEDPDSPMREISLLFNMRSNDFFLGNPFNLASYGLLLEIIAKEVNMLPGEMIGNLGDTHLYSNHKSQASEQILRGSYNLPRILFSKEFLDIIEMKIPFSQKIELFRPQMFSLFGYISHPAIKAPLSN